MRFGGGSSVAPGTAVTFQVQHTHTLHHAARHTCSATCSATCIITQCITRCTTSRTPLTPRVTYVAWHTHCTAHCTVRRVTRYAISQIEINFKGKPEAKNVRPAPSTSAASATAAAAAPLPPGLGLPPPRARTEVELAGLHDATDCNERNLVTFGERKRQGGFTLRSWYESLHLADQADAAWHRA